MNGAPEASRSRRPRVALAASWARLVASAAFATFSLAVLGATAPEVWRSEDPAKESAPPRPVRTSLQAPDPTPPPDVSPLEPEGAEREVAAPVPSARQILIDLGPPRSEAFVDGRLVGQTPFVGQVKCRPGREIRIQVIPERGLPLEEKRVCPP